MRRKKIAAVLAAMALFGTAPVVSARHMAEDYVERVQRERQERIREETQKRRLQEQAETRRRAEEARRATEEDVGDEYDEELDEEEAQAEERAAAEEARREAAAREEKARRQEEELRKEAERRQEERRQMEEAESRRAEKEAEKERKRQEAEEKERRKAEKKEQERERKAAKEKEKAERQAAKEAVESKAEDSKGATDTGERILEYYLRRARERAQGSASAASAAETRLHVAKEHPMKRLETESVDTGGTLLFSDSPEYVKEPGILYTDVVKGDARVFYYHLNDTKKSYKVAVVLESVGGQYAVVRVTRRAIAAPNDDYFKVGKGLQEAYFADGQPTDKMYIGPDDRRLLLESMDKTILKPGELVSGMVDFSSSAPVRVSVLFYPTGKDPLKYVSEAEILPADEHRMRGTFVGMDRILRLKHSYRPDDDGVACVVLADGNRDAYREGVDATDGSLATNYGNYGVLYRLEIPIRGKTRVLMSPMGGVYAGMMRAESEKDGARSLFVPHRSFFFGENTAHPPFTKDGETTLLPTADLADLGVFAAKPRTVFEFSPPGASNLPIMMILAPEDIELTGEQGKTS